MGGVGSSLNAYDSSYYLFYGLGYDGYIGTITKFKLSERIKESELAKKKRLRENNLFYKSMVEVSSEESDEEVLNF